MTSAPAAAVPPNSLDGDLQYIRDVLQTAWPPQRQMLAIWIVSQKYAHNRLQRCQDRPAKHPH